MQTNGSIIEQGDFIYGPGAHGGRSEACYLARTRKVRKEKLRVRGLVFDETAYKIGDSSGTFFCLEGGHHFKASIEEWENNDKRCPYCVGERALQEIDFVPHVDSAHAAKHRSRYARNYLSIEEVQKRLALYKCKIHDESKFVKISAETEVECLICGHVEFTLKGVKNMFANMYANLHRNKDWKPSYPFCSRCGKDLRRNARAEARARAHATSRARKEARHKLREEYDPNKSWKLQRHLLNKNFDPTKTIHDQRRLTLKTLNERASRLDVVCTVFYSVMNPNNEWRCLVCDHKWIGKGKGFCYRNSRQKYTPCPICRGPIKRRVQLENLRRWQAKQKQKRLAKRLHEQKNIR